MSTYNFIEQIIVGHDAALVQANAGAFRLERRLPAKVNQIDAFAGGIAEKNCRYCGALRGAKQRRNGLKVNQC